MAQDFAKKRSPAAKKRSLSGARDASGTATPAWKWFFSGLLCGVFLTALTWLASQQPEIVNSVAAVGESVSDQSTPPKPRFDFYTLLPEQTVDVDVEPGSVEQARANRSLDQFLLQAGSFKLADDADRRRAELILLGLEARVEEVRGDNGRWFRVYIGPFESRSLLAKARSLTAQQGIDTRRGL